MLIFFRGLKWIMLILVCLPIVLIIRIIRPIYLIRFGWFPAKRIGHFAFDVEYYLAKKKRLEITTRRESDLFFLNGNPANQFLFELCENQLCIHPWVKYLYLLNNVLPFGAPHAIEPSSRSEPATADMFYEFDAARGSRDLDGTFRNTSPQLIVGIEQDRRGLEFFTSVGKELDERYVCIIARDSRYLEESDARDLSYHSYRDSDIDQFQQVAIALAEKGYWVFRMGKAVEKEFDVRHEKVIDYSRSMFRTDFLDIWLMANCEFCISTGLGLDEIADVCRRPVVFVNYSPLTRLHTWMHGITVPKHLYWDSTNRHLTLREYLDHGYQDTGQYAENGITLESLTSAEITDAALEMDLRLGDQYKTSVSDNMLQKEAWKQFREWRGFRQLHGVIHPDARIGASFLRRQVDWLS